MPDQLPAWQASSFAIGVDSDGIAPTDLVSATTGPPPAEPRYLGGAVASRIENTLTDGPVPSPSLLGMAASVAKSAAKFAASGFKTVTSETQRLRAEQCSGCQYHSGNRCRICGCFFEKKAWLPHEDCPIVKWPA